MLLARMLDGASGGNILVAQAYVADVTKPEHRARGMGLIGMAFGLGFVLGPMLGGLLMSLPVSAEWQLRLPFLVAAGFSTVAWVLVLTRLPESMPRDGAKRPSARVLSWRGIVDTIRLPGIGRLVLVGFLGVLAFASFEGTFALFLSGRFGWEPAIGGVRLRRDRAVERRRAGRADPPPRPPLRRAPADRRRALPGGVRLRRAGDRRPHPRPGRLDAAAGRRPGAGEPFRLRPALADHAGSRARGRLRHAQLGADPRPDDQLLGLEHAPRPGLRRRALLGRLRDRPPRPGGGRSIRDRMPDGMPPRPGRNPTEAALSPAAARGAEE